MKPTTLLFALILFLSDHLNAQTGKYAVQFIPAELLINADIIKREEYIVFDVKDIGKASYKVSTVLTLLNDNAKDKLLFHQFDDKFHGLEDVEIELYNANGILKNKYSKSDLSKQATGEGLVPDGKVYFMSIPANTYPLTLKINYEIKFKGILNYPKFEIQQPYESVQQSVFIARVPNHLDLRYKAKNTIIQPVIEMDGNSKIYTWKAENLPPFFYESGSVSRETRYPQIMLAPNKFELDNYEGDMSSWQNFGKWYASLQKESLMLPDERKIFLKNLIKTAQSETEKVKIIYTYLQNNFRYVSIQLGIGGFKPFEANFVDKKKYGDCKALSNYMQACLSAVEITSYQALVNATYNQEAVDPDFPVNQFNHVILCVPQPRDSIWLECTSSSSDFGQLGSFTENRNALLITEDGGKLVSTPKSKPGQNTLTSNANIELNLDGSGKAKISKRATGEFKQSFIHHLAANKQDNQKKYLLEEMGYIEPYDFTLTFPQPGLLNLEMGIEKCYDFAMGKKIFLHPRIYKIWSDVLPNSGKRTQDYYFEFPFIKTDTTTYILPNGLNVETLPKNKSIRFEFGEFTSAYHFDDVQKKISVITHLSLLLHKIPVAKYADTKQFFDNILSEYTDKIILTKL